MTGPLLAERVAVVSGAGQGIGREIARSLRAHGANVVLVDIDGDAAKSAAAEVDGLELTRDVTSEEQVRAVVSDTMDEFGRLDVFVNNAGVTRDASLKKMTVDAFDTVVTVHLRGTWLGVCEAAVPMKRAGEPAEVAGAVVFLASDLASYITGTVIEVGGGRYI